MARHAEKAFAVEDQDTAGLLGDEEAPRIVARVRNRGRTRTPRRIRRRLDSMSMATDLHRTGFDLLQIKPGAQAEH